MMRDPFEIPDPFENGIGPSCKSFDVLFRLDPTVFIPRRSRHCMEIRRSDVAQCPIYQKSDAGE